MNLPDFSFAERLAALLVVVGALSLWDALRHGRRARRWKEYSFLLGMGGLGALVGIVNDLMTSSISREYFVHGKQLEPGPGFLLRVVELGAQAGFAAAVLGAGLFLLADLAGSRPRLGLRCLVRVVWRPLVCAWVAALGCGLVAFLSPPAWALGMDILKPLSPPARERFVTVWGVHIGLYLGLLIGVVWGILAILASRRRAAYNRE